MDNSKMNNKPISDEEAKKWALEMKARVEAEMHICFGVSDLMCDCE